MKALVGAFNHEKALVGAFSVIVQPVVEPINRFAALLETQCCLLSTATWRSWARAPWSRSSRCRGRGSSAPGRCHPRTAAAAPAGTRGGAARGYTRRPWRSGHPPRTATRRTWPRPRHRRPRSPAARHIPAGVLQEYRDQNSRWTCFVRFIVRNT